MTHPIISIHLNETPCPPNSLHADLAGSDRPAGRGENRMSGAFDEFFGDIEGEFGVRIPEAGRELLRTPGEIIDFIAEEMTPVDDMTDVEHRDHVAAIVGELMARALGITRYHESSRFLEDLHVR
jgi:hypothetical protein